VFADNNILYLVSRHTDFVNRKTAQREAIRAKSMVEAKKKAT
jgi:hypothetical protein